MLTFADLRTRVTRLLDEATNTQTSTTNLVNDALNASHRRVCLMRDWPFMRWPRDETFTSTTSRSVVLNPSLGKLLGVWDTVDERWLVIAPMRNWEANGVNRSTTGVARPQATFGAYWPCKAQPTSASTLTFASNNAGDTGGNYQLHIRGLNSSGEIISETTGFAGATPVTSAGTYAFILNLNTVGTFAGIASVYSNSSTVNIVEIPAAVHGKQYPTLEFVETPASGRAYTYLFLRNPQTLSADSDLPEVPFPHSEMLVYDALIDMGAYNTEIDRKHLAIWRGRYDEILQQLEESQDGGIIGSQPRFVRDLEGSSGQQVVPWSL